MWSNLLHLLAIVPFASSVSALAPIFMEEPHTKMLASDAAARCYFPPGYNIKGFGGVLPEGPTPPTAVGRNFTIFDFFFEDQDTQLSTFCQFNETSVSNAGPGMAPRFYCEDRDVRFIWNGAQQVLTMLEKLCQKPDRFVDAEVTGSVHVDLHCDETGICLATSPSIHGQYISINHIAP